MTVTVGQGLALALTGLFAGAVGTAEAGRLQSLPRGVLVKLWLRRWPLRWLAAALILGGQMALVQAVAVGVRADWDAFLLCGPPVRQVGMGAAWPAVGWSCGGLVLSRLVYPPAVTAAIGTVLVVAQTSTWLALSRCLPLVNGRATWLFFLGLTGLLVAVGVSITGWRAAGSCRDTVRLRRFSGRMTAACLASGLWIFGDPGGPGWLPAMVGVAVGLGGLVILWWPRPVTGAYRQGFTEVGDQSPAAWLRLALAACLLHWLVLSSGFPLTAARGRRLLAQLARYPAYMTLRADPAADDWEEVSRRLGILLDSYRPHPWCGQWLLLQGWIESSRLHHFHTATILVRKALTDFPRARAIAPPGWARGSRVAPIARAMLAEWGRVLNPGREPA